MSIEQGVKPKGFETLPIIDKIISCKLISPLIDRILGHKTLGPIFKKMLDREIVTYIICGVLTTIVGLSSSIGFYYLLSLSSNAFISNYSATISSAIAAGLAILFAFTVNKHFVFLSKDWSFRKSSKEFLQFVSGRLIVTAGEVGLMGLLVDILRYNFIICKIFTLVLVMIVNYIISKMIF